MRQTAMGGGAEPVEHSTWVTAARLRPRRAPGATPPRYFCRSSRHGQNDVPSSDDGVALALPDGRAQTVTERTVARVHTCLVTRL